MSEELRKHPENKGDEPIDLSVQEQQKSKVTPAYLGSDFRQSEETQRQKELEALNEKMEKDILDRVLIESAALVNVNGGKGDETLGVRLKGGIQKAAENPTVRDSAKFIARLGSDYERSMSQGSREIDSQFGSGIVSRGSGLEKHGINEFIDIRNLRKEIFETIPASRGFLGLGRKSEEKRGTGRYNNLRHNEIAESGKDEPAVLFTYVVGDDDDYCDDRGRRKNMIVEIIVPESTAKQLQKMIDSDPTAMRRLVEREYRENVLREGSEWEGKFTMRPPYEKWDAGGKKIYVQKEDGKQGFHEENMHQVISK